MFFRRCRKRFVRPLQNSLRADVNPASRRHLPVHHQPRAVQFVKAVPIIPVAHQIRIAQQHPRRIFMRPENPHPLSRLHQQRLVRLQRVQRPHNRMKTFPIPRRLARSAVHHQIFRLLRHFGIEVVQQHPQRRLLLPSFAGNLRPPRRPKWPLGQARVPRGPRCRSWYGNAHEFPSPPLSPEGQDTIVLRTELAYGDGHHCPVFTQEVGITCSQFRVLRYSQNAFGCWLRVSSCGAMQRPQ